jgi:hypothetical protein
MDDYGINLPEGNYSTPSDAPGSGGGFLGGLGDFFGGILGDVSENPGTWYDRIMGIPSGEPQDGVTQTGGGSTPPLIPPPSDDDDDSSGISMTTILIIILVIGVIVALIFAFRGRRGRNNNLTQIT